MSDKITLLHGSGGAATSELIHDVFAGEFDNDILSGMEDAAVLPIRVSGLTDGVSDSSAGSSDGFAVMADQSMGRVAVTTDSFVIDPVEYPGGNIGRLAVCGTVNDLLMRGAVPVYLTCGWILETGADMEVVRRCAASMADTAREAGVSIVAGDTKVIGGDGGIYINTTGVGIVPDNVDISAANAKPGDVILVSGNLGDHHAAVLSERMSVLTDITSDTAPLTEMCRALSGLKVHTMRDVTRGGLGTVLKEICVASGMTFIIHDELIPVSAKVRDFCGLLGLDPVYMGNEGKMVVIVDPADEEQALEAMRSSAYGTDAVRIGEVTEPDGSLGVSGIGALYMKTAIGGLRELDIMQGEGLPRIC
ncbi:MAG: hydrogenase expression/formation protein HypE [Eubacterium sp.]|nr:hydrogenase expression/formation protein HypE [Eubacterium sp.]